MVTPLTDAINALTTYANETTGASDTNLSDAVGTLVDGYGGYTINQVIGRTDLVGAVVDNTVIDLPLGCLSNSKITSFSSTSAQANTVGYAFYYCDQLKTVDMPNFIQASNNGGASMFNGCSALESINIPKWRRGGGNMFQNCTSLQMLVLPSADYALGGYFANGCTSLTTVDIGGGLSGNLCLGNGFSHTGIKTLILRRTGSILTTGANNFNDSPLAASGAGGDIYVPNSLLSAYQSAANWSTLNATWHAIEGSIYETKYADGTPIS